MHYLVDDVTNSLFRVGALMYHGGVGKCGVIHEKMNLVSRVIYSLHDLAKVRFLLFLPK
jgi:hypothetical protein